MSRVVVLRVAWPLVRRTMLVTMSGIKSRTTGMDRVIVAKRDAFEIAGRTANVFGLAESHVVRRFTFEDEIRRLFCR